MKRIIFFLTITVLLTLGGIFPQIDSAASMSATEKQKIIKKVDTKYKQFISLGAKKLNDPSYTISSHTTASNILNSKDRKDYLAAYNQAKKNGLANDKQIKKNHKEYTEIIRYLAAVRAADTYRSKVKNGTKFYKSLLSETNYKAFGINEKNNRKKYRGEALYRINQYKKLNNSSTKRANSITNIYKDPSNYALASHHLNLANKEKLNTTNSVKKAETSLQNAKKYTKAIKNKTASSTLTTQIKKTNKKINEQKEASIQDFEVEVARLVNIERNKNGLHPLTLDSELSHVARVKSKDMYINNYFDHYSPKYGSPFDMMKEFGITYSYAGENIAYGYTTPAQVMDGWMNSKGHRENILKKEFSHIGVGYSAQGHFWTQMFIRK